MDDAGSASSLSWLPDIALEMSLAQFCGLLIRDLEAGSVGVAGDPGERFIARVRRFGGRAKASVTALPSGEPPPGQTGPGLILHLGLLPRFSEDELDAALGLLARSRGKVFFAIPTIPSEALTQDGGNVHRTVRGAPWWLDKLSRVFPHATHLPGFFDEAAFIASWEPSAKTLARLDRLRRAAKLRSTLSRIVLAPADLFRAAVSGFVGEDEVLAALGGRSVALVGNSPRLSEMGFGAEIDAAEIVVRLNRAPIINAGSHGRRTDWMATGVPIPPALAATRGARLILWMTKLRRMPRWMFRSRAVHHFSPRRMAELEGEIGRRPSTGFMLIDLIRRSECSSASLYGFDFFENLSLSGWRKADEVPHDWGRERALVEELLARDARFTLRR